MEMSLYKDSGYSSDERNGATIKDIIADIEAALVKIRNHVTDAIRHATSKLHSRVKPPKPNILKFEISYLKHLKSDLQMVVLKAVKVSITM